MRVATFFDEIFLPPSHLTKISFHVPFSLMIPGCRGGIKGSGEHEKDKRPLIKVAVRVFLTLFYTDDF